MKLSAPFVIILCASLFLAACDKKPKPPPPPPAVTTTKGILDHSRWEKWVQAPPRILLVSSLDAPTQKLIAAQVRIFTALVSPSATGVRAPAVGDIQAQLDAVKNSFPATRLVTPPSYPESHVAYEGTRSSTYRSYFYTPLTVPMQDRWDSYRRTVAHTTLTNLPGIISQLERKIESDLRDLELQLTARGTSGAQAHADTAWLRGSMTDIVEQLKKIGKPTAVAPSSPADKARQEWTQFEATELPLIKKVIDANTIAETTVAPDGTFSIEGRGQPVAVITVAGRQLYFSLQQPGALRFFNMETSTR